MLNIYRVISLSLVMSLFFAAPLLCIYPVSYQLRNEQRLVTDSNRARKAKVVLKRGSHIRGFSPAEALANSLRQSENGAQALVYKSENKAVTPAVFVQKQDEHWYEDQNQDVDGDAMRPEFTDLNKTSHTSLYY